MTYTVQVTAIDGYTTHSTHASLVDAIDQADMVRGRVLVDGHVLAPDSDAYHTGYAAADSGEDRTACEYAAGTWERAQWLAGYSAAAD